MLQTYARILLLLFILFRLLNILPGFLRLTGGLCLFLRLLYRSWEALCKLFGWGLGGFLRRLPNGLCHFPTHLLQLFSLHLPRLAGAATFNRPPGHTFLTGGSPLIRAGFSNPNANSGASMSN